MKTRYSLVAAALFALAAPAQAADLEKLRAALQKHMSQGNRVTSVAPTPYTGIYEVVINNAQIGYTDELGQVYIAGPMLDMQNRVNITQNRLFELRKVDFKTLPLDKAIVKVKGNGERKLAVFSDPDCPYCKELEPELEKLKDVTIYTFLYPLTQIHPDAMRKATLVWCSANRTEAWDNLMLRDKLPENGNMSCATPILEIIELAKRLGITGTPGLIFPDGRIVPGNLQAGDIEKRLQAPAS